MTTFRTQASIDPNKHKGTILLNSITQNPLALTGTSLTNSQPAHVAIVDGDGSQITSFGGGTQYAELTTTSPGTGTLSLGRYKSSAPTLTDGQMYGLQLNVSGALKVDGTGGSFPLSGTVAVTQSTSPWIVAGGGTAGTAASGVTTVQGIASMTPVQVSQATGTNLHAVIDSGTITTVSAVTAITNALPAGTNGIGKLTSNSGVTIGAVEIAATQTLATVTTVGTVTSITNQVDANLKQVGGTNTVTAGVAGTQAVGGNVATNVAIGTNPINLGAQAVSSENAAVTTARMVQLTADLVGKLIVLPYANPENFVSGAITSAMTGTTTTSLIGAPASGLRNYITQITVSNAHATVGTDVIIQDGSGGTTLYTIPAAAVYGGATLTFPTPLRQPTTATAIFCANVTTGASTKVSASGYKGA